jgi:hypothetical protein
MKIQRKSDGKILISDYTILSNGQKVHLDVMDLETEIELENGFSYSSKLVKANRFHRLLMWLRLFPKSDMLLKNDPGVECAIRLHPSLVKQTVAEVLEMRKLND